MPAPKKKVKRHVAFIESPINGVATYRTEGGALIFTVHYSADPEKGQKWVLQNASLYAGGTSSAAWGQEMELDDLAEDGERVYHAFDRARNVCAPFDIPLDWPISLGWDFGQTAATAVVFVAQDPISRNCYVFDSLYRPKGIDPTIKRDVYDKIAKHRKISLKELQLVGIDRFLDKCIGDPSGVSYQAFYAMEPFSIGIATQFKGIKINDAVAGESHVNAGLTPRIICCNSLQYNPNPGEQHDPFACSLCGKVNSPAPTIYVFDGMAEELVEQWDSMVRKRAQIDEVFGQLETPETNVKMADHAADAARYVFRVISYEPDSEAIPDAGLMRLRQLEEKKERGGYMEPHEEIEAMVLEKMTQQAKEDLSREIGRRPSMWISNRPQKSGRGKMGYGIYIH